MASSSSPPKREMQEFEKVLDQGAGDVASFEERERRSPLQTVQHLLHGNPTIVPLIVLVVAILVFGAIARNFLTSFNLSLIIGQVTIIGLLGIAQTLIILTAGIDLSVAAIMMLASVIMGGLAVNAGLPALIAIPIGLAVGGLCGLFNGTLVAKLRLPPFIVTLGSWSIFFALLLWLSGGESIRSQDIDTTAPLLKIFGYRISFLGAQFTTGSILMLILFGVFWYVLNNTPWGRHVYAVGDDAPSAQLAGIRTDKVLISVYATAGVLCGIAGWAAIGRVGSVSPQSFYEGNLDAITAVVIGGTSLFGGRGSILGTLIGALIVGVFRSGLNLSGVDVLWQQFAVGALIIIAVATDQWLRKVSG
ncbi:MAG TPA: ABC transporter permease [Geminicoccaceae bacterium]